MQHRHSHLVIVGLLLGLICLLVNASLQVDAQAGRPTTGVAFYHVPPAAVDRAPSAQGALTGPADMIQVTVLTLNISNHAPGRLIDALIAQGHGNETLFQVLGYLKAQTGGAIPDAFYQDVANAPAGSEVAPPAISPLPAPAVVGKSSELV